MPNRTCSMCLALILFRPVWMQYSHLPVDGYKSKDLNILDQWQSSLQYVTPFIVAKRLFWDINIILHLVTVMTGNDYSLHNKSTQNKSVCMIEPGLLAVGWHCYLLNHASSYDKKYPKLGLLFKKVLYKRHFVNLKTLSGQ